MRAPLAYPACEGCQGHGYDAFDNLETIEIERNDDCGCLEARTGIKDPGDDVAVSMYEQDLAEGKPWATRCEKDLGGAR